VSTPIPPPHEPFVDTKTGIVNEVWYRYLSQTLSSVASLGESLSSVASDLAALSTVSGTINGTTAPVTASSVLTVVTTGVPAGVRRLTVSFNNVSMNTTSHWLVQFGTTSGVVETGYQSGSIMVDSSDGIASQASTAGFIVSQREALRVLSGNMSIIRQSSHTWTASHAGGSTNAVASYGGGHVALGAELDRVAVRANTTTDNFDSGAISVFWEF
jgi:uncharacterized protein YaiE (UPF0345 family)